MKIDSRAVVLLAMVLSLSIGCSEKESRDPEMSVMDSGTEGNGGAAGMV